jgi:pilus assembly protein CpaE
LSVLLVGREEVRMGQARDVLHALGEPRLVVAEAQPAEAAALSAEADVAMIVFGADEEEGLNYLQKESERMPRPVLFALLSEQSDALMRRVLRAGADEVLFLPLAQGDLMRPLLKVSEALRRSARRAGGKTFSVASLGGGAGVTTLCANLGLALQGAGGVRVALVDLALQEGGLSNLFGAEPERGILALARLDHKPDSIGLEAALTKHSSGLYVLGAPVRIEDSEEVSDTTVGNLIELIRQLFD